MAVGRQLTIALVCWLIFVASPSCGDSAAPGSENLAAGVAIFGMANVPFVYWSAHLWRTVHPKTSVVMTLVRHAPGVLLRSAFRLPAALRRATRGPTQLEALRASCDDAYLSAEDLCWPPSP